jgi:hypothetical protein
MVLALPSLLNRIRCRRHLLLDKLLGICLEKVIFTGLKSILPVQLLLLVLN